MSNKAREKMAQLCKDRTGKWNHTQEVKDFISKIHSKPIIQLDLKGNFIKEWKSAVDAAKFLNGLETNISNVARNNSTIAYGYIWVYKDNYINFDLRKHFENTRYKRVVQLDLSGNYIDTFYTISEAKRITGASNIYTVCKGIQHTSGGFKWMFEEDYLREVKHIG
jgi:hypothetical protein